MSYGYIYAGTHLDDGRTYVGQTIQDVEKYINTTYIKNKGKGRTKLFNAINKDGTDKFHFDVIDYADSKEELDERESYWIEALDSIKNGFNLTTGGRSCGRHTNETKEKISKAIKGRVLSDEHKKKIGDAHRGKVISLENIQKLREANLGKKMSEETKKKMSESQKGKKHDNGLAGKKQSEETKRKRSVSLTGIKKSFSHILNLSKPIISIDGQLFFYSNTDAKENGYTHAYCVARGKRPHCKGIVFRFATPEEIEERTRCRLFK